MNTIQNALANDPTKDLIKFLEEESKRQEAHDERFLQIMECMVPPRQTAPLPVQISAPLK